MALLVATVVIYGSLSLSAAPAKLIGTSTSISVKTKIGQLTCPAAKSVLLVHESVAKQPLFEMVQIHTSSKGLKQLRGRHLDIVRVRVDSTRVPDEKFLSGSYIVEAVITKGELGKLRKMGFEVFEMSERK